MKKCAGRGDCLQYAGRCPLFRADWAGSCQPLVPLAPLTTFRVGGPAAVLARPASLAGLRQLLGLLQVYGCPWRALGRGSNLLVADRGYAGVVILLDRQLEGIARSGDYRVRVEAGCSLARLLGWSLRHGLGGLEFLVGIPGSVGGALLLNAGTGDGSLGQRVVAVELVAAAGIRQVPAAALDFGYRQLAGVAPGEVVGATILELEPAAGSVSRQRLRQYMAGRRRAQPRKVASAGSFFKNPPGAYAGRLIEEAGLKGTSVGGAQVAVAHANFLVNRGGATAAEVRQLMALVQEKVWRENNIWLQPEVHMLGFDEEAD
ncbi:MAG: UDP-N-acetylmuramate dehydrogenase [Desulfurivibrio sp.]|nr:UDP-N-acetylmuramate dehydrogenase [Desulfurivibrio sp.]